MAFGKTPAVIESDHYGTLNCPCGGGGNLHQENVTVFHRGEDGKLTTVLAQSDDTVQVSKFPNGDTCNPSPRRHGLLLEFVCEQCHYSDKGEMLQPPFQLAIFQHKGHTFVEWV